MLILSVCSKNSPLSMLIKAILIKHNRSKWSGAWKFEGNTCKEEGHRSGKSSEGVMSGGYDLISLCIYEISEYGY